MLGYDELLTEKCSYEKYNGVNKYNEKSYDKSEKLECFTSYDFSNVLGIDEQRITLKKIIFIKNKFTPNPQDRVDGLEIKQITPVKGLLVPIIGWRLVL